MKINIRLTILSIVRVEQMLKKPFTELDYSNEEDLTALLYCMMLANNKDRFTLKEFKALMESEHFFKEIMKSFEKEGEIIAQFNEKQKAGQYEGGANESYIKDAAATLIVSGVDADFVMNKMDVCDLYLMLDAYSTKKKEQMESDRLWAYLSMLPHIDGKKLKSPQSIYPFPWEQEQIKKQSEAEIKEGADMLEKFLSGEIKFNI